MNAFLEKCRNPILISSILSTIFLILSSLDVIKISDSTINVIVNSIMSILSILGVLSSPYKPIDYVENISNSKYKIEDIKKNK